MNRLRSHTDQEIITAIINLNEGLEKFWSNSAGWAPLKASELLSKSRLDRHTSLSRCLKFFLDKDFQKEEGALILAWTALGTLTEGSMKLFLSVYLHYYEAENNIIPKKKNGNLIEPDELSFEKLRVFFDKRVFTIDIKEAWKKNGETDLIKWILEIQHKRNSIHAFKHKEIGSFDDFFNNLKIYLSFLNQLNDKLPYPDDEMYKPRE